MNNAEKSSEYRMIGIVISDIRQQLTRDERRKLFVAAKFISAQWFIDQAVNIYGYNPTVNATSIGNALLCSAQLWINKIKEVELTLANLDKVESTFEASVRASIKAKLDYMRTHSLPKSTDTCATPTDGGLDYMRDKIANLNIQLTKANDHMRRLESDKSNTEASQLVVDLRHQVKWLDARLVSAKNKLAEVTLKHKLATECSKSLSAMLEDKDFKLEAEQGTVEAQRRLIEEQKETIAQIRKDQYDTWVKNKKLEDEIQNWATSNCKLRIDFNAANKQVEKLSAEIANLQRCNDNQANTINNLNLSVNGMRARIEALNAKLAKKKIPKPASKSGKPKQGNLDL